MPSCFDFLLTPRTKSWVWAVPILVAQEVGGSQHHLGEACGCMTRENGDGRELRGEGEGEVISWPVLVLPLMAELTADLRGKVGLLEPWKVS